MEDENFKLFGGQSVPCFVRKAVVFYICLFSPLPNGSKDIAQYCLKLVYFLLSKEWGEFISYWDIMFAPEDF
jgi:hypothetical protein